MPQPLYAVVQVGTRTIKSKWFIVSEGKAVEVTGRVQEDVDAYNAKEDVSLKIPYKPSADGYLSYSFGCGLTHYLQDLNLKDVTGLDVDHIKVLTTGDFSMYGFKKSEKDWEAVLNAHLSERGE